MSALLLSQVVTGPRISIMDGERLHETVSSAQTTTHSFAA